jgi:anti-anti-sigma factor
MNLSSLDHAGTRIFCLSGRIDHITAEQIKPQLEAELAAVPADSAGVIIRMAEVEYISSAGLRVLMVLSRNAKARKLTLLLTELQPVVREIFTISHFDLVIPVHVDLGGALAALGVGDAASGASAPC